MTINITWPTDQDVEVVDAIRAAIVERLFGTL